MKAPAPLTPDSLKLPSPTAIRRSCAPIRLTLLLVSVFCASPLVAQGPAEQIEFFEKKIRPVLAEKCYTCHGSETIAMADLQLDSRAGVLKGGSRGPAVVPGRPSDSLLIRVITYRDLDLKMPPTGKLSDETIADFTAWIEAGAPDPREEPGRPAQSGSDKDGIDLVAARQFWAFQPVREVSPPSVKRRDWPQSPIDHFILAKLEEEGLAPAPPAEKRALLRRVSFDLVGIPPTSEEVEAFLADTSPQAFQRAVDRLLDSPHYGERWARHWLDLVRFAETNGHEYDNDKLNPWRYRDYVIKALNADLPYNQLVREHIAGDLLPSKRLAGDGSHWSSPLATGFFWLGEVLNSATDSEKSRADQIDNQLDVLGKAFLGLTVACARCHDHKFDPIPTKDYYSLAGILHSTDMREVCVDSPSRRQEIAAIDEQVADLNHRIKSLLLPEGPKRQIATLTEDLLAASVVFAAAAQMPDSGEVDADSQEASATQSDDPWVRYLGKAIEDPGHVFHPFAVLAKPPNPGDPANFADRRGEVARQLREWVENTEPNSAYRQQRGHVLFEDFEKARHEGWTPAGRAFGKGPATSPAPQQAIAGYQGQRFASSFGSTDKLVGTLTSEKFRMPEKRFIHVLMAGTKGDKRLSENSNLRLTLVADAHKSAHRAPDGSGSFRWQTISATKERGRICYFEIVDRSREGHIAVERIVFSDSEIPPPLTSRPHQRVIALLERPDLDSLEGLAEGYRRLFAEALAQPEEDESRRLLASLPSTGRLEDAAKLLTADGQKQIRELRQQRAALEGQLPSSSFAMSSADHEPRNIKVHIRGNHKNLGEEVPRRFLQVVAGENQTPFTNGSGRLELADWMASSENPLAARVIVNRLWKHHFGYGIVRTPDNFGKTGEPPTHPELLDFLASRLMGENWSLKSLHRLMVLSSTYQMSSRPSAKVLEIDPRNRLLSHMPVRRLEAEAIRDAILAVSGALDPTLYGPSVTPFIGEFQEGRGRPESGPLDGHGRRSIYLQVRRNFLPPMFLAFDYPPPISAIGQRGVSTVPSQALILLNNEFVGQQVGRWAAKALESVPGTDERVSHMFSVAFARPPLEEERTRVHAFLRKQQESYGDAQQDDPRVWADLAHVLINSPEFVFIQ